MFFKNQVKIMYLTMLIIPVVSLCRTMILIFIKLI